MITYITSKWRQHPRRTASVLPLKLPWYAGREKTPREVLSVFIKFFFSKMDMEGITDRTIRFLCLSVLWRWRGRHPGYLPTPRALAARLSSQESWEISFVFHFVCTFTNVEWVSDRKPPAYCGRSRVHGSVCLLAVTIKCFSVTEEWWSHRPSWARVDNGAARPPTYLTVHNLASRLKRNSFTMTKHDLCTLKKCVYILSLRKDKKVTCVGFDL